MVVKDFPQFADWFQPGALLFGQIALVAIVLGIFFGYLVAAFRHGPFEAFYVVAQVIAQSIPDFLFTSPTRVWALARLAIKEALRRKIVLVTFVIFATTLLFGGWFMNAGSENPERIYVNFVLWGTQMLILVMGMLLSAFSLPEDIKNKTIYTVVTKPVRPTEIVLGRIVGFGLLGTFLLTSMGVISFLFVWRGLAHTHQIAGETQTLAAFVQIDPETHISLLSGKRVSANAIMEAKTTTNSGHQHRLELIEDIRHKNAPPPRYQDNIVEQEEIEGDQIVYRRVICDFVGGHTHRITLQKTGESTKLTLGPAVGYFRTRKPVYADGIQFYDRDGLASKGISVGKERAYRGFVDGGNSYTTSSLSKVDFDFLGIQPSTFRDPEILPLEMTLSVFRTYKADIEKRVTGGLQFHSIPDGSEPVVSTDIIEFETNEYSVQTLPIPRKLIGKTVSSDGKLLDQGEYDLFDDLAKNGKIRLSITCLDPSQYIGVAKADVYFRAADKLYWLNFAKGYFGIWCQMMIIISMGVAFSTFLSSPVTMLGTVVMMIVGFFAGFIRELMTTNVVGGGPIESFIRIVTQKNMVSELETGWFTTIVYNLDKLLIYILGSIAHLAPDFSRLNFSEYLTYGYAVDDQRILQAAAITLCFCLGLTVLGYFALKTREIAK